MQFLGSVLRLSKLNPEWFPAAEVSIVSPACINTFVGGSFFYHQNHSVLKLFTGFAMAVLIV